MAIREGAWDCPHCGRTGNRGSAKFCGGCGAPRGEDVRFYLPDDAREVSDAAELRKAMAGPDWICPYCQGDNGAESSFCSGCGAPRDGAAVRPLVETRLAPPVVPAPQPVVSKGRAGGLLKKGCGIGCLGLLVLFGLIWFLGRPREATLTAQGFSWERSIQIEALQAVTEEAWEDAVPAGARVLSRRREVHHTNRVQTGTVRKSSTVTEQVQVGTERVKVGTRDLGNGYFEDIYEDRPVYEDRSHEESYDEPVYREDPVFAVKVRYEIDKWLPAREEKAAGQDRSPRWPEVQQAANERAGARKESYEIRFLDDKGKACVHRTPREAEWRRFEPGGAYRATVKPDGEVARFLDPEG
ncbi:MAG TPA: hypothetical protein DD490_04810 [Acidobacteria bacterium]|nr:hypothetical protein [Acidobacteriota bacterium]